ncbi:MAG: DUF6069 family protein [Phototrophicaceae bacterium]
MATVTHSTTATSAKYPILRVFMGGIAGGIVGAILNVILFFVAGNLLGIELVVPQPPDMTVIGALPLIAVIMATLMPSIGASILFWALQRFVPQRATIIFLGISVVFLVLSLLFTPPVPNDVKIILSVMHIIAAAAIVGGLNSPLSRAQ